jgi:hypothetical protein
VSDSPIVLEAVWDCGVTAAADEALNEGGPPQHYDKQRTKFIFKRTFAVSTQNNRMYLKIINSEDFF